MAEALPVLYLSGPMTGMPAFNYPAFDEAARKLRKAGFEVLNPAENSAPEDAEWSDFMRMAITQMMKAGAVALLPGWMTSKGAKLEYDVARKLGMPARTVRGWQSMAGQWAYMDRLLEPSKGGK